MTRINKKGKSLKDPRHSITESRIFYTTKVYEKYDKNKHSSYAAPDIFTGDIIMKDYKGFPLWIDRFTSADSVPANNIRIDDYTISKLLKSDKSAGWLHARWPVEFDKKKMIKAVRMPLGFAAKMHVDVGDVDRNGVPATEAGWYYKWYRGLHVLCGLEGEGGYMHRPDWEYKLTNNWYFDKDSRCVYQEGKREPMAQDQIDTVIGSRAIEAVFHVREQSDPSDPGEGSVKKVKKVRKQEKRDIKASDGEEGSAPEVIAHIKKRAKSGAV